MAILPPPATDSQRPTPEQSDERPCRDCGCDFYDHNHPDIGGCGSCGDCDGWY